MVEAFRRFWGTSEEYELKRLAPFAELQRVIVGSPNEETSSYLGSEFRGLLKRYGQDFDLPFGARPIGRPFEKSLLRRAAIMVAENPVKARVLVVETDSRYDGGTIDPDHADLLIWPMQLSKDTSSTNLTRIGPFSNPNPHDANFLITIKKIGASEFVEAHLSVSGYRGVRVWQSDYNNSPVKLLKDWAGLQ